MKIAVLITGQLRDYKINCFNHLKHLIEPNNADLFVYACCKNTIHSLGTSLEQEYSITNRYSAEEITKNIKEIYGPYLKELRINLNEKIPDHSFGTLGYFRTRMQNQIDNIRIGYEMAIKYSEQNNFEYDLIVRCRPDNVFFPKKVNLKKYNCKHKVIYSTIYKNSGHRDICVFAFSNPKVFKKYSSFEYLKDEDPNRVDEDFICLEHSLDKNLTQNGVKINYLGDVCIPFIGYDKTLPMIKFPYINENALLLDSKGNFVKPNFKNYDHKSKLKKILKNFIHKYLSFKKIISKFFKF